jgi:CRP/FNR family cyclic AMP-dependent transcriptional regulator
MDGHPHIKRRANGNRGDAVVYRAREDQRAVLKRHFLFGGLGDGEIAELLAHAQVKHYDAGDEIFAKGSPGQSTMAVLRGAVKISSQSPEGKEIFLDIINAGEFFGEIAMLDGRERTADATAVDECELLVLYRRDFLPFLERRPDICIMLIETLCKRVRQTGEQVEDAVFGNLGSRVAKVLLRLAQEGGRSKTPVLRVTQQELGSMVGSARESVNRHLHVWQAAGLIKLGKGAISICDVGGLQRMT